MNDIITKLILQLNIIKILRESLLNDIIIKTDQRGE